MDETGSIERDTVIIEPRGCCRALNCDGNKPKRTIWAEVCGQEPEKWDVLPVEKKSKVASLRPPISS